MPSHRDLPDKFALSTHCPANVVTGSLSFNLKIVPQLHQGTICDLFTIMIYLPSLSLYHYYKFYSLIIQHKLLTYINSIKFRSLYLIIVHHSNENISLEFRLIIIQ